MTLFCDRVFHRRGMHAQIIISPLLDYEDALVAAFLLPTRTRYGEAEEKEDLQRSFVPPF